MFQSPGTFNVGELSKSYSIRSDFDVGFRVFEVTVIAWLITVVVITRFVRIDDRLPGAVKTDRLAAFGVCDQTDLLCLHGRNQRERLCLKSQDGPWIGSVQGAVATWSNHRNQEILEISHADH